MKTRRSKARTVTPFANPKRQFRARREVSPARIHNIYSFYESESDTENVDIETLTLEQYLALDPNNTRRRFMEDLAALFGDDDFEDDASDGFYMEKVWEVNEEWLMAPIIPPPMLAVPPPSVYELGLRVYAVEGQVQVIVSQMAHAVDRWEQVGAQAPCSLDVRRETRKFQQLQTTVRRSSFSLLFSPLEYVQPGEFTDAVYFGIG
ncbi:hypothetical protein Tco_0808077 [Tanacetum coccineum]